MLNILNAHTALRQNILATIGNLDEKARSMFFSEYSRLGGSAMTAQQRLVWRNETYAIQMNTRKEKERALINFISEYNGFNTQDDMEVLRRELHETLSDELAKISRCSLELKEMDSFSRKSILKHLLVKEKHCNRLLVSILEEYRNSIFFISKLFHPLKSKHCSGTSKSQSMPDSSLPEARAGPPTVNSDNAEPVNGSDNALMKMQGYNNSLESTTERGITFSWNPTNLATNRRTRITFSYRTNYIFLLSFQVSRPYTSSARISPSEVWAENSCNTIPNAKYCNSLCCDAIQMYSPRCRTLLHFCF